METVYFVLIRDVKNNKEYIYNNHPVKLEKAKNFFKDFIEYQQTKEVVNYMYEIHDKYCELFRETVEVEKGWIWNGENKSKDVSFILTLVELSPFFKSTEPEKIDQETQFQSESVSECLDSLSESLSTTCTFSSSYRPSHWFDWNAKFQRELIDKLASPNLGLKPVKYY